MANFSIATIFIACFSLLLVLTHSFSVDNPTDRRILVLLDDLALKSSHSIFFSSLQTRGFELDFKLSDDPKIALQRYGQHLYDGLILFSPATERFGGSLDVAAILDFVDSGRDLIVAADASASDLIRNIAAECGVDFDEDPSAVVIDHGSYAVSETEGDHTLIAADDFIQSDVIIGSKKIEAPVLFKGIAHSFNPLNSLVLKVLSASTSTYSANPNSKLSSSPSLSGSSISLVSVVQARNNARAVFSGSLDLFSNKFFKSPVQKAGSSNKLGKTLLSITLLYTLLRQGFDGKPIVKKAIIVTPTSLVSNWEAEIKKWVGERVKLVALCESSRDDVISSIDHFRSPHSRLQVLIVSYETFRMHSLKFNDSGSCDLLICDEAHRLKNDQTLTNRALAALSCKQRILLSGTPMQNHLEEFYAMVNFTNPGILGDAAYFRRYYETPIICGREPTASEEEKRLAEERSAELSAIVNQFILRRTNALLSNHLPPKIVEVVCCKLTPLQKELYTHFIHSKNVKQAIAEDVKQTKVLAYITALKKLCNHPKLIYDTMKSGNPGTAGFEGCMRFFPPEMFAGRSGSWTGGDGAWVELSGKMHVLARLLGHLRKRTDDRIVLVSNYTQTLDLIVQLCRERRYPFLRLDGTTSISKRQKLVNCFNDPSKDEFAFLLSSKAGGCGLNLIGGNRLVLFDPDWNPANDKQAAARVWRDGQKKRVYIYRFLSTGTIEEKVYQRQMSKEGLQKVIQQEQADSKMQGNNFSTEDLRDLFTFHEDATSEIHEKMNCTRCREQTADIICIDEEEDIGGFAGISECMNKLKQSEKQIGSPLEEDLANWGHHYSPNTIPDIIFQASAGDEVSFVFTNQISGKLVPVEPVVKSKTDEDIGNTNNRALNGNLRKSYTIPSKRQQTIPCSWSKGGLKNNLATSIGTHNNVLTGKPRESTIHVASKPNHVSENYLPQKRVLSCPIDDDDDFV